MFRNSYVLSLFSTSPYLKVRIVCSAEKEPAKLFLTVPLAEEERENNRLLMDDLGIDAVWECILLIRFKYLWNKVPFIIVCDNCAPQSTEIEGTFYL